MRTLLLTIVLAAMCGCRVESDDVAVQADEAPAATVRHADPSGRFDEAPTPEELEQQRSSGRWRGDLDTVRVDTVASARAEAGFAESAGDIAPGAFGQPPALPLGGRIAGPSVLQAQVLLDRASFSPGIIDGHWGDNAEKAVFFFQVSAGLAPTGVLDRATFDALRQRAGAGPVVVAHALTEEDVSGPFADIPTDIYEQAELDALGYESVDEKLSERFHTSPALLSQLNPGQPLDQLAPGDSLLVPAAGAAAGGAITGGRRPAGAVARLLVSGTGGYLHALGADGRILMHFPVTVGLSYDPSPQGDYRVTAIARNPEWRYDPALLANVPDDEEPATIPAGPNNAVGLVWMALSEPHYGIHGTKAPETIGYTSSSGCVRLTNWDALTLADAIRPGTPVAFRGTRDTDQAGPAGGGSEAAPTETEAQGPASRG